MTKLEQLKKRAEFFPRGKIVPNRILKCSLKRLRHNVRFGADTWAIQGPDGYVCFSHYEPGNACVKVHGTNWPDITVNLQGSPYHKGGSTHWIQDFETTPEKTDELLSFVLYK